MYHILWFTQENIPLNPTVAANKSVTYPVVKFLAKLLLSLGKKFGFGTAMGIEDTLQYMAVFWELCQVSTHTNGSLWF